MLKNQIIIIGRSQFVDGIQEYIQGVSLIYIIFKVQAMFWIYINRSTQVQWGLKNSVPNKSGQKWTGNNQNLSNNQIFLFSSQQMPNQLFNNTKHPVQEDSSYRNTNGAPGIFLPSIFVFQIFSENEVNSQRRKWGVGGGGGEGNDEHVLQKKMGLLPLFAFVARSMN